ncbi:MAG: DUF4157 domain-containing protein [Cyanobacteriota bacterium]
MITRADKTQENKSQSVAKAVSQKQSSGESIFRFVDNRPEAIAQRKLEEMANNSPQVRQLKAFQDMADNSYQAKQMAQLQAMADNNCPQQKPTQKKENNTGLPDNLKTGIENLSGMFLDDVKVHRHSDKPAQLQAHAYAQGTDIYLGPGQEKHLPHEAWHVVQQKQGRVKPTMQIKGKVNVNDDVGLEKEADEMGVKASQLQSTKYLSAGLNQQACPIMQRQPDHEAEGTKVGNVELIRLASVIESHKDKLLKTSKSGEKETRLSSEMVDLVAQRLLDIAKTNDPAQVSEVLKKIGAEKQKLSATEDKSVQAKVFKRFEHSRSEFNGEVIQGIWIEDLLEGIQDNPMSVMVAGAAVVITGLYLWFTRGGPAPAVVPPVPAVVPPAPVVAPPVPVHSIDGSQVNSVQARIAELVAGYAADRVTLNAMLARGNIVYRNQQTAALVALNDTLIARTAAAAALTGRGAALAPGVTPVRGYKVLLSDVRDEFAARERFRRALNRQNALPRKPTVNIGVGAFAGAAADALSAAIVRLAGGGGGAIADSVFVLPGFRAHPEDHRWEVRIPPITGWIGADPLAAPLNVIGNGSIPTTAHGARNLPAARTALIAAMNAAGYV